MYGDATYATPTAYMDSTTSWFVCYRVGEQHSGGNNIWYYSVGDRPFTGMEQRHSWGYIPAINLTTPVDPQPGMAACPDGATPAPRVDKVRPVLFVHGYNNTGAVDCNAYWGNAMTFYYSVGWNEVKSVGYYSNDTNCELYTGIRGNQDTPIENVGNDLAWLIWNQYSRFGVTIDIIAHSMGGLVTRVALTGTQYPNSAPSNTKAWPPYLLVEDVSTLSTPHNGIIGFIGPCIGPLHNWQCRQMAKEGSFLNDWITNRANPQAWYVNGRGGTDWTVIGSRGDLVVNYGSALDFGGLAKLGHKVLFTTLAINHGNITEPMVDPFNQYYCDNYNPCNMFPPQPQPGGYDLTGWNTNPAGADPVEVAMWGNYYASGR